MSILHEWAAANNISHEAFADLRRRLGMEGQVELQPQGGKSESAVQANVRLEASAKRIWLGRNNSGAYMDSHGRQVRYGLGNDSEKINRVFKSSDLIGWRSRVITPDLVGVIIAQVLVRECKPADWRYTGTAHERAQLAFINRCNADGGDAAFCTGPGTL